MRIEFTTPPASGSGPGNTITLGNDEARDRIVLNSLPSFTAKVEVVAFPRATAPKLFKRDNTIGQIAFTISREFSSVAAARVFSFTQPKNLLQQTGTLTLIDTGLASSNIALPNAMCVAANPVDQIGVRLTLVYQFLFP